MNANDIYTHNIYTQKNIGKTWLMKWWSVHEGCV
jgi:hypothetical protein